MKRIAFTIFLLSILNSSPFAQNLVYKRTAIGGGGGAATSLQLSNHALAGQFASGGASDGRFENSGGFFGGINGSVIDGVYDHPVIPIQFELSQNYPNPFNSTATINYAIAEQTHVRLELFNILGQRVAVLVNETQETGNHSCSWNASSFPTGVYFYKMRAGEFNKTNKMLLLK